MKWNNIYLLFRINPGVGVLNAASSEFSLSSLYDIIFTINPGIIQYVKKEFSKLFFPLMFSPFSQVFYVFFLALYSLFHCFWNLWLSSCFTHGTHLTNEFSFFGLFVYSCI